MRCNFLGMLVMISRDYLDRIEAGERRCSRNGGEKKTSFADIEMKRNIIFKRPSRPLRLLPSAARSPRSISQHRILSSQRFSMIDSIPYGSRNRPRIFAFPPLWRNVVGPSIA